jgi:L-lactate dehydrogenase complex protein LldF
MTTFRDRIRNAIANEPLQTALDANVERRLAGRAKALGSLPDWESRRRRAHAVRAEVIEHLDEYLAQFTANLTANGITVHRAADAAEAVGIILEIVASTQVNKYAGKQEEKIPDNLGSRVPERVSLVAKSKSMVSEEIELNHALEAAGHKVVETDLGEYIVQLRGEKPSHIITPAVHLRRSDVGRLFAEKLGLPYTEDIPTLINIARKVLRQVFLTADVGISGVNFGVAETGSLTLITNEGNGRMVTTLPPVHIALMGIERLVPTLDDLALMLSLLPRSATGQKMSVYTQLIQRPLPGQTRHLILLDNGRSRLRASPLRESLYCIRCGACLNACPVFREIGGHAYDSPYPGPIGSVISAGLFGPDFAPLAQASSLCGACKEICPVDIDLPKMLLRVRAGQLPITNNPSGLGLPRPVKLGLSLYVFIASRPGLFAAAQRTLGLLAPRKAFISLPAWTGWGLSKDMPVPAKRPFRDVFGGINREGAKNAKGLGKEIQRPPISPEKPKFDLVERFIEEIEALGGHVTLTTALELSDHLLSFLQSRGIRRVQAWESILGLDLAGLAESGLQIQHEADPAIKAGLTGALAAVAETGTLVIPSGPGHPLTASLLPEIHIAVLRKSDILPDLETALHLPGVAGSDSIALVSGPSRTADIEMTLTIGVHGPGELLVFVVDG